LEAGAARRPVGFTRRHHAGKVAVGLSQKEPAMTSPLATPVGVGVRLAKSRLLRVLFLLLFVTATAPGCQLLKKILPAKTIDNPEPGTREWLVLKALEAAKQPDTNEGWKILRPLLHTQVVEMVSSETSFRNNNFEALHRKVRLFLPEDGSLSYKLDEDREDQEDLHWRMFVVTRGSDMPSPVTVRRDAKFGNEWRIVNIP
jgi:hypothetical protein